MVESSGRLALRELRGHFGCWSRDNKESLDRSPNSDGIQANILFLCIPPLLGSPFCPVCVLPLTAVTFTKMALVPQDFIFLTIWHVYSPVPFSGPKHLEDEETGEAS